MEKVKVSSDVLYQYITEHGIKLTRLAEHIGLSDASINSCFKHNLNKNGVGRTFTHKGIERINMALPYIADTLRELTLHFGSSQVFTNQHGRTYDPALVEQMKKIGNILNLTALVERVLGWNKSKKENILVIRSSKVYGNISEDDVNRINAELLAVAGVLGSYEVVPDDAGDSEN